MEGYSMADGDSDTGASSVMLQPGQTIRPKVSELTVIHIIESLYGLHVLTIKELNSYDDRNYLVTVSSDHCNRHIAQLWPHGYVFKVLNSMDSRKKHVDAECQMQRVLLEAGFNCPQPVLNSHGQDNCLWKLTSGSESTVTTGSDAHVTSGSEPLANTENNNCVNNVGTSLHIVRLLTFQPGILLCEIPYTADVLYEVGKYVGAIDRALQGFSHSAFASHRTLWNLESVPNLTEFLFAVKDADQRRLVEDVINSFTIDVIPIIDQFQKGVIHGDFNEQNVIVQARPTTAENGNDKQYDIHAVIDFGDCTDSYYVFEAAITVTYMMVESAVIDPMKVAGHVLAGYLSQQRLTDVEFDALKVCVAGRYAQSLVLGAYSYTLDPGNEYLLVTEKNGWPQLKRLWDTPKLDLYRHWRDIIQTYDK